MSARNLQPTYYRAVSYDGRSRTGLDGAEIADARTDEPGTVFYRTARGNDTPIPQDRTPRRARMRAGVVEHVSNRWHGAQYFRVVEIMRADSFGPRPTLYGWRAVAAVEVTA